MCETVFQLLFLNLKQWLRFQIVIFSFFFLLTAFNFHSFFDIDHQSFDHKKRAVKKNSNYPVYIVWHSPWPGIWPWTCKQVHLTFRQCCTTLRTGCEISICLSFSLLVSLSLYGLYNRCFFTCFNGFLLVAFLRWL